MEELTKLKRIRIKKDQLSIVLKEKKEAKSKSLIYLSLFVLVLFLLAFNESAPSNSPINDGELGAGTKIVKFISGKFLWLGIIPLFRILSLNRDINSIEREYQELVAETRHLSN